MKKNDFLEVETYKTFVMVSILSMISTTAGSLIDNVVAGRMMGDEALKAMSICGPLVLVFSSINNLLSTGGTVKAAQAIGRGDRKTANNYFSISVYSVLIFGSILTVITILAPEKLAGILGAEGELKEMCALYLKGYMLNTVPHLLMSCFNGFVKIDGSPRLPLMSVFLMSVSDIILDLLFVGPMGGGMYGLGLATTCAYTIGLMVSCTHFIKKRGFIKIIRPKRVAHCMSEIIGTGLPTAMVRFCMTLRGIFLNHLLMVYIGTNALVAMNIRTQTENFFGAVTLGIAQALIPVIAYFYGKKERLAIKNTLKFAIRFGLIINSLIFIGVCIVAKPIVYLFKVSDPEQVSMAQTAVILFALSLPLKAVNNSFASLYQSTKKKWFATAVSFVQSFAFSCPVAALLTILMPDKGVWISFVVVEIITLAAITLCVAVRIQHLPRSIDDLLLLSSDYGKKYQFTISVRNTDDEIQTAAKEAASYGAGRGLDDKTCDVISSLVIETGTNIKKYGLEKEKTSWFDISMNVFKDETVLVFRDNGIRFDPVEYTKKNTGGRGMQLLAEVSKKMEYSYDFGLNELCVFI